MSEGETTQLLQQWQSGDAHALDTLLPLVYNDLRRMARAELSRHRGHDTLQPTALVNDLFVRILGQQAALKLESRQHFFNTAAQILRQLLVARSRAAGTEKRGGAWLRQTFEDGLNLPIADDAALSDLDDALRQLAKLQPRMAQVVELRCFAGLEVAEVAQLLQLDERTVYRDWATARAWLRQALSD